MTGQWQVVVAWVCRGWMVIVGLCGRCVEVEQVVFFWMSDQQVAPPLQVNDLSGN